MYTFKVKMAEEKVEMPSGEEEEEVSVVKEVKAKVKVREEVKVKEEVKGDEEGEEEVQGEEAVQGDETVKVEEEVQGEDAPVTVKLEPGIRIKMEPGKTKLPTVVIDLTKVKEEEEDLFKRDLLLAVSTNTLTHAHTDTHIHRIVQDEHV